MLARGLVVGREKRLNIARFRVDEKWLHRAGRLVVGARFARQASESSGKLLRCDRRGETAVERLPHATVFHRYGATDHGQLAEVLVSRLDAEVRPVGRARELADQLEVRPLFGGAHVVFQKIGNEQVDGALAQMRQARMSRLPLRIDTRQALARIGDDDTLSLGERRYVSAHDRVGDARDRVRRRAAFDVDDRAALEALARERAVVEALLAIAHGELGVGSEEKRRVGEALAVVRDVAHSRFLVRAEDDADRVGQLFALVGPKLHRAECRDDRALIVDDAAAHKIPLATRDGERIDRPTRAGRNHVDMTDDSDLRIGLAGQVGISHITIDVVDVKAHVTRDVERLGESRARAGPKRRVGLRCRQIFRAFDAHDAFDIRDDVFPMLFEI